MDEIPRQLGIKKSNMSNASSLGNFMTEWFEAHWGNNSYAERICYSTLKAKEAWEKFTLMRGKYTLYRIWFVTIKL